MALPLNDGGFMRSAFRSQVVIVSLWVAFAAACQKTRSLDDSTKRSIDDVTAQVDKLQKATSAIRARIDVLPESLSGLDPVRSKLSSIDEVLGVEAARVKWLSREINAAVASGSKQQIQSVSDTIRNSVEGIKGFAKVITEVSEQLASFEQRDASDHG